MKKVLITGGLGFLGSHSVEKFKREGWQVTVVDNLSSNVISPQDPICEGVNVIVKNVLDYGWISEREPEDFDIILHLASPVGPVGILKHSGKMAHLILKDIYWAIAGAKIHRCPLVFVSTSEIYGHRDKAELLVESDDKILRGDFSVRNEYSVAKLLCEIVLENTAKVSDLKYQIIRPFNISGARQLKDGGFVLPTFVNQAFAGDAITVFGNGEQVRAFTHVKDIVDGIYLTCMTDKTNGIWNIGHPGNICNINELAMMVKDITESRSEIMHVDPKAIHGPLYEEAWDKIPNSDRIQKELGWSPRYTKREIVEDVVEFYQRNQ